MISFSLLKSNKKLLRILKKVILYTKSNKYGGHRLHLNHKRWSRALHFEKYKNHRKIQSSDKLAKKEKLRKKSDSLLFERRAFWTGNYRRWKGSEKIMELQTEHKTHLGNKERVFEEIPRKLFGEIERNVTCNEKKYKEIMQLKRAFYTQF